MRQKDDSGDAAATIEKHNVAEEEAISAAVIQPHTSTATSEAEGYMTFGSKSGADGKMNVSRPQSARSEAKSKTQ